LKSGGNPLTKLNAPILEFDPDKNAILNPRIYGMDSPLPTKGVMCFFQDVIQKLYRQKKLEKIGFTRCEMGKLPIYQYLFKKQKIFVVQAGLGAPFSAGLLEELIVKGARQVVACGGCGVLKKEIAVGHLIIVNSAVRDEGTSYHYLPPSREVQPTPSMTKLIEKVVRRYAIPYILGKTWTTDGFFRETIKKRDIRLQEGCLTVEMEAAALFAVAQFRGIKIGQILYGGDIVVPEGWDHRDWGKRKDIRENLFWLAVEATSQKT
jgi:uridine phosphorylase